MHGLAVRARIEADRTGDAGRAQAKKDPWDFATFKPGNDDLAPDDRLGRARACGRGSMSGSSTMV